MAQQPRASRERTGQIRTSGVNPEQARNLRVGAHFRFDENLPTISNQYADGTAVIDFPVGLYTYRAFGLRIENSVAIAGETISEMGVFRLNSANLSKYVASIALEINGKIEQEYTAAELIDFNELMNWDVRDGIHWLCFGSPGFFKEDLHEDAYLLGTANIRSVRLLVKLQTAWLATMKLIVATEYAPVARPIGYIVTHRQQRYSFSASGEQTISDIPHGIDLAAIWVRALNGKRLDAYGLRVDDQQMFDCSIPAAMALGALWGKDTSQLAAGNLFIDFWREGDANKGLAALAQMQQVRRNADIRLTLNFGEAAAEIKLITFHCGLYSLQR